MKVYVSRRLYLTGPKETGVVLFEKSCEIPFFPRPGDCIAFGEDVEEFNVFSSTWSDIGSEALVELDGIEVEDDLLTDEVHAWTRFGFRGTCLTGSVSPSRLKEIQETEKYPSL